MGARDGLLTEPPRPPDVSLVAGVISHRDTSRVDILSTASTCVIVQGGTIMKALKASTLNSLNPLLDVLRAHPALREVRPAEFALDDKDFVHFHEDSDGVFADVRLKEEGRVHMPVSSPAEQAEFLERIDRTLEALEQREEMRGRRGRNKMRTV